ncbi:MAG: hypothetical protein RBU23_12930 [Candidatus Auribacterota bacterium]|jgi:hypothetical protein|nr:hypothetical protein [Candidatus Auribacterota bacterium]
MKNVFIAFMLGLFVLAAMPTQSMADAADQQHEAVVFNQPGNAADVLQALPLTTPAAALVDMPSGKKVCMAGLFAFAQDESATGPTEEFSQDETPLEEVSVLHFFKSNWGELIIALLAFVKVVVRLTPTLKDDKVFGKIDDLISFFIPSYGKKA